VESDHATIGFLKLKTQACQFAGAALQFVFLRLQQIERVAKLALRVAERFGLRRSGVLREARGDFAQLRHIDRIETIGTRLAERDGRAAARLGEDGAALRETARADETHAHAGLRCDASGEDIFKIRDAGSLILYAYGEELRTRFEIDLKFDVALLRVLI